jgi:hypothetical protein
MRHLCGGRAYEALDGIACFLLEIDTHVKIQDISWRLVGNSSQF